jgi:hypothetical protein
MRLSSLCSPADRMEYACWQHAVFSLLRLGFVDVLQEGIMQQEGASLALTYSILIQFDEA